MAPGPGPSTFDQDYTDRAGEGRLAYVLTRFAQLAQQSGDLQGAARYAGEGLAVATEIRRASEMALAQVVLLHRADEATARQYLEALRSLASSEIGASVRARLDACLADELSSTSS